MVCAQLHQITLVQLTCRRKQLHKRETERALCLCTAAAQTWHCAVGVQGVQEMSITERGDLDLVPALTACLQACSVADLAEHAKDFGSELCIIGTELNDPFRNTK